MSAGPRYPIYIPSKDRADSGFTARVLEQEGQPFLLVVEPQQAEAYIERFGAARVLVLPFRDRGSVIPARNWIKTHATDAGFERHWQIDDNIRGAYRIHGHRRIRCPLGIGLRVCEDFADRYENVALAGLNYYMFGHSDGRQPTTPFRLNVHVYSCTLILNALPYSWRGRYNEDTDYCLQVLAGGWCTILLNAFLAEKEQTMTMKGGNTTELYAGDGRLKMSRALERLWPGIVKTSRRFGRPQHRVAADWGRFDTPLKLKAGIDLASLPSNEYGLELRELSEPQNPNLRGLAAEWQATHGAPAAD